MLLTIISPEKTIFKGGSVQSVAVPGKKGRFMMLENHAPIISTLGKGDIVYVIDNVEYRVSINAGLVETNKNNVTICIEENKDGKI